MKGTAHDTESPKEDRGGSTQGVAQTPPFIADDLSIPAFLKREDTTESKTARERMIKQAGRRFTRLPVSNSRSNVSTGYATLDETGKAILREAVKRGDMSDMMRNRAVRALRRKATGDTMTQVGSKETTLREQRKAHSFATMAKSPETLATLAALNGHSAPSAPVAPKVPPKAAEPVKKETVDMRTKTNKKKSDASARTPVKGKTSKSQKAEDLLLTAKGATQAELEKVTGWPNTNMKTALERARRTYPKAKLEEKDGRFRILK